MKVYEKLEDIRCYITGLADRNQIDLGVDDYDKVYGDPSNRESDFLEVSDDMNGKWYLSEVKIAKSRKYIIVLSMKHYLNSKEEVFLEEEKRFNEEE